MKSRRQALQLCLDATVVVVIQICSQFLLEVFHGLKLLQIQQLTLKQPKEVLNHSVVHTVSLAAHALPDALFSEHPLVLFVLVLPALVGMKDQSGSIRYLLKSLVQHGGYHAQHRSVRDRVADQITAVQVEDWREIQFLSEQTEFCYIGNPLLVRLFGMKVSVQQIWSNLADFTPVGTIFFHSDMANQAQLLYEPLDCLVVQGNIAVVKFCRNAAVAVSTFVFVIDGCDFCFGSFIFVCAVHPLQMIVKSSTGQSSD